MKNDNKTFSRRLALHATLAFAGAAPVAARIGNSPRNAHSIDANPVVETNTGKVRGFTSAGVSVFRGIPYGASTSGVGRFLPPQKVAPWTGVRNCLSYGPSCPQPGLGVIENEATERNTDEDAFLLYRMNGWIRGEDCLRLNVWTPSSSTTGRKRAVMVYMHGGGFVVGGSGNDLLCYDGENLARHDDVVVVTHNHRLNLFGYLNLAGLGNERYASSANVGMLDIVAVLEWVRDNIANFGGDPSNATIYGQSGGGGKVNALMAIPAAKGLFHRAIVQSGSMILSKSAEDSAGVAALLLEELGISKSDIAKIHEVPTSALQAVQPKLQKRVVAAGMRGSGMGLMGLWGPVADGKVIPSSPFDPAAPAISADIPMIIGTCMSEFEWC